MAERAHPRDFREKFEFRLRRGFLPWISRVRNPYRQAFFWRYRWVAAHAEGLDALDVPCGMGWGTSLITGTRSLVGVDISIDAINEARRRYKRHARFQIGDMRQLDFADSSFDLVSCLEGIEHVSVEIGKRFLSESFRVLRPNGLLFLSSPYCRDGRHSGNPYHIREYQPDELKPMVEKYFEIQEIIRRNVDHLTVMYMKCRRR